MEQQEGWGGGGVWVRIGLGGRGGHGKCSAGERAQQHTEAMAEAVASSWTIELPSTYIANLHTLRACHHQLVRSDP